MFLSHGKPVLLVLALLTAACGPARPQAPLSPTVTHAPEATDTPAGPTATATPLPTPTTRPLAPRDFEETFNGKPIYWGFLAVDNGQSYAGPSVEDGFLVFGLPSPNQWAYGLYNSPVYNNVLIEAELQMRTAGDGAAGLVCRYDEKNGWYEFNIFADQSYQLLFGQWLAPGLARYTPLYQGKSEAIKGDTNQIGLDCQGNSLTPIVNGARLKSWPEMKFGLEKGRVGLSASSFMDAPFAIAFDWVRVSEP